MIAWAHRAMSAVWVIWVGFSPKGGIWAIWEGRAKCGSVRWDPNALVPAPIGISSQSSALAFPDPDGGRILIGCVIRHRLIIAPLRNGRLGIPRSRRAQCGIAADAFHPCGRPRIVFVDPVVFVPAGNLVRLRIRLGGMVRL